VAPAETRRSVLAAAARVFSSAGYERATIAEIAREAGVSSGAIYAHYDGKAELFYAVLAAHVQQELEAFLQDDRPLDIGAIIAELGANLDRRPAAERTLLIEAVMAAKHDDKTRAVLSAWFTERHEFIAGAIGAAQHDGSLTDAFSPGAAARFTTTVLLGSMLLDILDVPEVEHDDWARLVTRIVNGFRVDPSR
jgi:AcrR family transcriptional regulator